MRKSAPRLPPRSATYLHALAMTPEQRKRVDAMCAIFHRLVAAAIDDLFVNQVLDERGASYFEHLWIFGGPWAMEARFFLDDEQHHIKFIPLRGNPIQFEFKSRDYDFDTAGEHSRLDVVFALHQHAMFTLKAVRAQCDDLRDIALKYFAARAPAS